VGGAVVVVHVEDALGVAGPVAGVDVTAVAVVVEVDHRKNAPLQRAHPSDHVIYEDSSNQ